MKTLITKRRKREITEDEVASVPIMVSAISIDSLATPIKSCKLRRIVDDLCAIIPAKEI